MGLLKRTRWPLFLIVLIFWVAGWGIAFLDATAKIYATSRHEAMQVAAQSAAALFAQEMAERSTEIDLLRRVSTFTHESLSSSEVRQLLELRQSTHEEYLWIGVANPQGVVVQGTNGVLVGESVAARPWFKVAQSRTYIGDVHEAALLAGRIPESTIHEPLRFVDFASPIVTPGGQLKGVLAGHASWNWVGRSVNAKVLRALGRDGVEMLVINQKGECLYPVSALSLQMPVDLTSMKEAAPVLWPDGKVWVTAVGSVKLPSEANGFTWHVVIRQLASASKTDGEETMRRRFIAVLIVTAVIVAGALYLK